MKRPHVLFGCLVAFLLPFVAYHFLHNDLARHRQARVGLYSDGKPMCEWVSKGYVTVDHGVFSFIDKETGKPVDLAGTVSVAYQ